MKQTSYETKQMMGLMSSVVVDAVVMLLLRVVNNILLRTTLYFKRWTINRVSSYFAFCFWMRITCDDRRKDAFYLISLSIRVVLHGCQLLF
jgi:hypothetical protein